MIEKAILTNKRCIRVYYSKAKLNKMVEMVCGSRRQKDVYDAESLKAALKALKEILKMEPGGSILDWCGGFGGRCKYMLEHFDEYFGFDLSENLVHHFNTVIL